MRKQLISLSAAVLVAALAGCSSGEGSGTPGNDAKVSLTYGIWDKNQQPAMEQIIDAFEAGHKNIDVTIQLTPSADYQTKLQVAASSGTAPDVFWMNGPNFQLYAANNQLLPLEADTSVYPEALTKLYQYNGVQYGLPKDFDTIGLWYNKELFDAAGVAYPNDAWTWADLQAAAKKLTNGAKGVYGIAAPPYGQENYYNTIAQAGGHVLSSDGKTAGYDDPKTIAGLKFWTDLVAQKVSPSMQAMTDTFSAQLFESGKVAMYYAGSWNALSFGANAYLKKNADVAVLPMGQQRATVIHGLGNVAYAKTKHPDAAKEFVKFLGSKEAAEIQGRSGAVIPAYNGTQQTWVASQPQFNLKVYLDQLPYAVALPVSQQAQFTAEYDALTQAWSGKVTIEDAAAKLNTELNALLAKKGK